MSDPDDGQGGAPAPAPPAAPLPAPAPEPASPPAIPLDATALAKLRELDPDGAFNVVPRVLAVYRSSLHQALQELTAELTAQQAAQPAPQPRDSAVAELLRIAHKLKSSSASVGALALSRACNKVEQDVRSGTPFEPLPATQQLLDEGHAALAAVEAMLRS